MSTKNITYTKCSKNLLSSEKFDARHANYIQFSFKPHRNYNN